MGWQIVSFVAFFAINLARSVLLVWEPCIIGVMACKAPCFQARGITGTVILDLRTVFIQDDRMAVR